MLGLLGMAAKVAAMRKMAKARRKCQSRIERLLGDGHGELQVASMLFCVKLKMQGTGFGVLLCHNVAVAFAAAAVVAIENAGADQDSQWFVC